ncbi:hypothetical protein GTR02_07480 [Kineococcus sp. R8]|uniref:hypothetical protein n=1 Tax=Kineococcus siccus TaxID=2696567 RepID=UPI001412D2C7|nr:hypothetical protein [Kineococcus siccus]NAZ81657.1 hypothetical protein [Kineococcus siccus]
MISLLQRRDGGLGVTRARHRTTAFVYGNITVLGAVLAVGAGAVASGSAVLAVLATALTTFVAHVVADVVAARVTDGPDQPPPPEHELREELRDATPVATSGLLPAVVLGLSALDVLPVAVAQPLAALVVVVRLALTGVVVERLSGVRRHPLRCGEVWRSRASAPPSPS